MSSPARSFDTVLLDAGPLGMLAHPRANAEITAWLRALLADGVTVLLPETTDFEVRRSLVLANLTVSIGKLDELGRALGYLPITTQAMRRAADLWADARQRGIPTADPKELDCDVVLAAQALEVGGVVATANVGHLGRYVTALHWRDLS